MTLSFAHRSVRVRNEAQQLREEPGFQREKVIGFNEAIYVLLNLPFSNDDDLIRIIREIASM